MNSLYDEWRTLQPDQAEQIALVQESFMAWYQASQALWNAQTGADPSPETLKKAYAMVCDHTLELCCMLNERYSPEMMK